MDLKRRVVGNARTTDEEAKSIIDGIKNIQTLRRVETGTDEPSPIQADPGDQTDALMYLSRMGYRDSFQRSPNRPKQAVDPEGELPVSSTAQEVSGRGVVAIETEAVSLTSAQLSDQMRDQKRRFAKSLETLSTKQEKRKLIVDDGAVGVLVELSEINDGPIKLSCAIAFSYLASERQIRPRMIEAGAFGAIISLASCASREVKSSCIRALCNLCYQKGHEPRAVKDGVPLTVYQIAVACPDLVHLCLKTLLNLSCVPEKFSRLEEVMETLMLLNSFPLTEEDDLLVISILSNLSALRNNQLRVLEDGCMTVVERIVKSPLPSHRQVAAEVLRNLCSDNRTRNKIVDMGIIAILLSMSRDSNEAVKSACVQAFYNLSKDTACREKIVNSPAVSVIIKISMEKISTVEMGRVAAKTLRGLCGDRKLASKLVRDGIIKALMCLISTDDGQIRLSCAESICSLCENEQVLGKLIEQGAVGVLVSLSHSNLDRVTAEWCAFAHYHLSTNDICPSSMLQHGILPCLLKLCYASTLRTKLFCSAALLSITLRKEVDATDAIPILVHMMRHESDKTLKNTCASALYNLADNDTNCDQMLSSGALMPIVSLAQSDHVPTKIKCTAILSRLSQHEKYHYLFGAADVVGVLLELSGLDHAVTQRRVAIALSKLSQGKELRKLFIEMNATQYIIALASRANEQVRRGCVAFICNLAYDVGSEAALVNAGIVSTLLITALITSDQIETKLICVKALVNLMSDSGVHKVMVKEGIIWGLATLAQLEHPEIRWMCGKALCNLSIKYARDMLSSNAAINAVLKLMAMENVEVQRESGRVLTNILLETTDEDTAFRKHVVRYMSPMARSTDKEVGELCILCLSLISQSPSCRTDIVQSGMLKMIEVSTIFSEPSVGYAYITMFGNIAKDPDMRTYLLDKQAISRFLQIVKSNDDTLVMAVVKALYSISCAKDNILCLAQFNTMAVIRTMWNQQAKSGNVSLELCNHIVAYLYNLTTNSEAAQLLVSQGIVQILTSVWPLVIGSVKYCHLIFHSICQLACSPVNTARMVEQGCGKILCFSTQVRHHEEYALTHMLPLEALERCSAALRNLCTVISNQDKLVELGAVQTLVDLVSMKVVVKKETHSSHAVKSNCASALRSMTFNDAIRDVLIDSGGLSVILNDLKVDAEVTGAIGSINPNLMREMEAESWSNGSRGVQKEERAPYIEPEPIFTDLMNAGDVVELDVKSMFAKMEKHMIQVQLEEPPIETEEASTLDTLSNNLIAGASFEDSKIDSTKPETQRKQECNPHPAPPPRPESAIPLEQRHEALRRGESLMIGTSLIEHLEVTELFEDDAAEDIFEENSIHSESTYTQKPDPTKQTSFKDLPTHKGTRKASDLSIGSDDSTQGESKAALRRGNSNILSEVSRTMGERLPDIKGDKDDKKRSSTHDLSKEKSSLPAVQRNSLSATSGSNRGHSFHTKKYKAKNSPEDFEGLVSLIRMSKRSKGEDIEKVMKKWGELSRF